MKRYKGNFTNTFGERNGKLMMQATAGRYVSLLYLTTAYRIFILSQTASLASAKSYVLSPMYFSAQFGFNSTLAHRFFCHWTSSRSNAKSTPKHSVAVVSYVSSQMRVSPYTAVGGGPWHAMHRGHSLYAHSLPSIRTDFLSHLVP